MYNNEWLLKKWSSGLLYLGDLEVRKTYFLKVELILIIIFKIYISNILQIYMKFSVDNIEKDDF